MSDATARIMMVFILAGAALALSTQSAAAGGGSAGVTVILNGDSWHHHDRFAGHRFAKHRLHRAQPRALHRLHGRHPSDSVAGRAFQRSAPHAAGFHHHRRAFREPSFHRRFFDKRFVHEPADRALRGHHFPAPRILSIRRPGKPHFATQGPVVVRPSGFHGLSHHHRPVRHGTGGKLILLSPSSRGFKHIIVVPSRRHGAD